MSHERKNKNSGSEEGRNYYNCCDFLLLRCDNNMRHSATRGIYFEKLVVAFEIYEVKYNILEYVLQ